MARVYQSEWHEKLIMLMSKHNLAYLGNPGGGQFYNDDIDIQIHDSMCADYSAEYEQLLKGLQKLGLEP